MKRPKALVVTGYGLNCDYETHYALELAGAEAERVHINRLIGIGGKKVSLLDYQIFVLGGGFSWADDHGAGVLMANKLRKYLGEEISTFLREGGLAMGICNGFQGFVNLGLLPGLKGDYNSRKVALIGNDRGNFIDIWVKLRVNPQSPCVFTKGIECLELPVRHAEGKFYAEEETIREILDNNQVVLTYALSEREDAHGLWPYNPNGSLMDIAGICDSTGRVFGLMPHPEAFNHFTNHPLWTYRMEGFRRGIFGDPAKEPTGIQIFQNAVKFVKENL
ncbi:MAG: phosphoribosylformylglycinamidine synthase subunit PurQ [Desulfatiglandales bacterium]